MKKLIVTLVMLMAVTGLAVSQELDEFGYPVIDYGEVHLDWDASDYLLNMQENMKKLDEDDTEYKDIKSKVDSIWDWIWAHRNKEE